MIKEPKVLIPNFFGLGQPLLSNQLGWNSMQRRETKTSVSRKIFEKYVEDWGRNMVLYYLGDGNFYGIHSEKCPTPVFRFQKNLAEPYIYDQLGTGDTHNYEEGEILYMVPREKKIWDVVRIDGKNLEEIIQNSYIVNIS